MEWLLILSLVLAITIINNIPRLQTIKSKYFYLIWICLSLLLFIFAVLPKSTIGIIVVWALFVVGELLHHLLTNKKNSIQP